MFKDFHYKYEKVFDFFLVEKCFMLWNALSLSNWEEENRKS